MKNKQRINEEKNNISVEDAISAIDGEFLVTLDKQILGTDGFSDKIGTNTIVFDSSEDAQAAINALKGKQDGNYQIVRYENKETEQTADTDEGFLSDDDFDENGLPINEAEGPVDATPEVAQAFQMIQEVYQQIDGVKQACNAALQAIRRAEAQANGKGVVIDKLGVEANGDPMDTAKTLSAHAPELTNAMLQMNQIQSILSPTVRTTMQYV